MRIIAPAFWFISLLSLTSLPVASTAAPATGRLPRSTPEAQGVSSTALLDFVAAAEEKVNALHSFMLVRHGHVIAEGWWAPYAADELHEMYSLSKSFTSTAVGLAIAEGKLSVDDPVLKFFPDEAPGKPSANLRAMRVRDLLTMSAGHHREDLQGFPYDSDESVVKKFLALPVTHKPGTFFVYNTPASYTLSAIVQNVTGESVLEYLRPRLFEPLGIAHPEWATSKQGVSLGGFGLSIRTEDIAKFGQLYLQRGHYGGKQILPSAWVDTATSRWMSNGSTPASDWEQGYGFQFWRCRHGVFRGDGAHGQFCIVFPQYDAVLALTGGTRDLQGVLNVVWDRILPALQANPGPLPGDAAAHARLQQKLARLSLPMPVAIETPPLARSTPGQRYIFSENNQGVEALMLNPSTADPKTAELTVTFAGAEQRLVIPNGSWRQSKTGLGASAGPIGTSGAWTAPDTFTFDVVRYRTPFAIRYRLRFAGDTVTVDAQPNVRAPVSSAAFVGQRQ